MSTDLERARELLAQAFEADGNPVMAAEARAGEWDGCFTSAIVAAYAEEREACAKMADDAAEVADQYARGLGTGASLERGRRLEASQLASAIRARGGGNG